MSYRRNHLKPKLKSVIRQQAERIKHKKKFFQKSVFWVILFFLFTSIIAYFALFYPKLQVTEIKISGNKKINTEIIEEAIWPNISKEIINIGFFQISSKSILLTNTKKITEKILKEFPAINGVEIEKKLPQSLILEVKERKPFVLFCQLEESVKDMCYVADESGIIFELSENIQDDIIIARKKQNEKDIFLGKKIFEDNIGSLISKVDNTLKNNFQIGIKEVLISNPMIFTVSENWQIYFDPDANIDLQIRKLEALLKDEIKEDKRKSLQYIYLQYKDRAYYK